MDGSISERKLAANRANAQLSTGPRMPRGKAKGSRNALKHGLLSSEILLQHEDPGEVEALRDALYEDLQPFGALEEMLVEKIVTCARLQKRAVRVETILTEYEHGVEIRWASSARTDDEKWERQERSLRATFSMARSELLNRIQRYKSSKERQMYSALHELELPLAVRVVGVAFVVRSWETLMLIVRSFSSFVSSEVS